MYHTDRRMVDSICGTSPYILIVFHTIHSCIPSFPHRNIKLPTQYTIYDYWYDPTSNTFEQWSKSPFLSPDMMEYDTSTPMASVTVPTPETCSVTFWMKKLVGRLTTCSKSS